ncbi:MAG TPA: ion channel [Candidatus Dormibacteraeota bacterium]|nr:ion channel [Candidatus Dormibacteraeota bacterium]
MRSLAAFSGFMILFVVLWDAFETIILPRRVTRKFRLTRLFYRSTWRSWRALSRLLRGAKQRDLFLSFYAPLSLLFLLIVWAAGLIAGFALLHWADGSAFQTADGRVSLATDFYLSGSTFFSLGLGGVAPHSAFARAVVVIEAGLGFGFLAMMISYLPVIYQAFSRREVTISLLDARAGSPPTAVELLRRLRQDHRMEALQLLLHEWERWSAELLESHLSYPMLAHFRSQHNNQSWLGTLTAILDTSALLIADLEGPDRGQAKLTFAISRRATVDLAQVFALPPVKPAEGRLSAYELTQLRIHLATVGLPLREDGGVDERLARLRQMYEPHILALSRYLSLALPPWLPGHQPSDNWQSSAWDGSFAPRGRSDEIRSRAGSFEEELFG